MFKTNDRIISSPAAANQVVYIGSYDSHLYAVNIIDGTLKWKYQMGALVQSTPLVHNGTVYAASFDKHMYTFDTSGVLKWKYNINGPVQTSPVYYDLTRAYYPTITGSAAY
jgi:outer membrane protein assembly factor BamB